MTEVRDFRLPDLGEGLEDAEVVAWRVAEGDRVELNQTLVEVNTAKALVEIPAPWEGVVERLHAGEGDVVKVGDPLVSIRVAPTDPAGSAGTAQIEPSDVQRDGPKLDEAAREDGDEETPPPRRRAVLVGYGVEEEDRSGHRHERGTGRASRRKHTRASPPVRKLARDLGIDLASLDGSGPNGRVTREDVLSASRTGGGLSATPVPFPSGEERRVPVRGTRRMIAEKMSRAVLEIPHVTTFLTVDATQVQAFRQELTRETAERVSPLPIVVRALVEVWREHPKLNSSFDAAASEIVLHGVMNVGIATDTEHGLLVPVIRDAASMGIVELSREIGRLSQAARSGRAAPQDMVGSTVTVTNVGTFGAESGTPIINHPEAAILALGVIEPRALVVDGRVEARPAGTLSLSFDHRVMDGAEAGRALKALGRLLESPFRLGALPR